jgi:hypothetical protein
VDFNQTSPDRKPARNDTQSINAKREFSGYKSAIAWQGKRSSYLAGFADKFGLGGNNSTLWVPGLKAEFTAGRLGERIYPSAQQNRQDEEIAQSSHRNDPPHPARGYVKCGYLQRCKNKY